MSKEGNAHRVTIDYGDLGSTEDGVAKVQVYLNCGVTIRIPSVSNRLTSRMKYNPELATLNVDA